MKGKYFGQDFGVLALSHRHGSCHMWQSFVHGADLLKEGCRWNVRNVKNVSFGGDKWLTNSPFAKNALASMSLEDGQAKISDYYEEMRGWRWEKFQ